MTFGKLFSIITGSNSKLLSKEYTNDFSGRYVSFIIRPFVYKEIKEYFSYLKFDYSIIDYLIWGGFPKRFEFKKLEDQIKYLSEIKNSIVEKDLIIRFNINNSELFKRITNYVLKSNSRILSARSIEGYMGYNINVFKNNEKEIDFLAFKNNKKYYIQVAYSIADEKTDEREFVAFKALENDIKKIIITNDDIDYSTSVVTHIKLKDFLELDSLDEI